MANRVSTLGVQYCTNPEHDSIFVMTAHMKQYKLKSVKLMLHWLHVSFVQDRVMMPGD